LKNQIKTMVIKWFSSRSIRVLLIKVKLKIDELEINELNELTWIDESISKV